MRLATDRFSKTRLFKLFDGPGKRDCAVPYDRHSYESHGKLYDVDRRISDGSKTYHVNCGFDTEPEPIHREIERFFGI